MLYTLALRLAIWDAGCDVARYVSCRMFSACGVTSIISANGQYMTSILIYD